MYSVYSFLTLLALVVLTPYFVYQALRHNKYVGTLGQRLGYLPVSFNLDADDSIWVHAVSVGEVLAARPLLSTLRRKALISAKAMAVLSRFLASLRAF